VDYIVLEMAENGELFDFLYFPRKGFGEEFGRYLFKELINGIEACHQAGVVHRDLKTENIMLSDTWGLKIADFGYATLLAGKTNSGKLSTYLGTLSYAAPEMLAKQPYLGSCADIFSCGIILFVLVTGKLPYGKAVGHDSYYRNFVNNDYEGFWKMIGPKIQPVSEEFKSLISLLLSNDPAQRPSINEIKSHPWFTANCISSEEMNKELEKRKVVVSQQRKIEADKKESQKVFKSSNSRVVKTGVYKGEKSNVNYDLDLELEREMPCFFDFGNNPYTVTTSEIDANELLESVYRYFMEKDEKAKNVDVHKKNYSMKVNYKLDEETEKILEGMDVNNLEVKVELKKQNNDENNLVIEFSKMKGDKGEFYEMYEHFTSEFSF